MLNPMQYHRSTTTSDWQSMMVLVLVYLQVVVLSMGSYSGLQCHMRGRICTDSQGAALYMATELYQRVEGPGWSPASVPHDGAMPHQGIHAQIQALRVLFNAVFSVVNEDQGKGWSWAKFLDDDYDRYDIDKEFCAKCKL